MKKSEFLNLVEDILEEDRDTLDGSELLEDLGWDSINFMSFISMVDGKLGHSVPPTDLAQCATVSDLVKLVQEKLED